MAGCCVIILIPLIIGAGIVFGLLLFGLPIYAAFALITSVLCGVGYGLLRRRGVFERYAADTTWRRYAALAGKWVLVACCAFYGLTGLAALVGTWFLMNGGW